MLDILGSILTWCSCNVWVLYFHSGFGRHGDTGCLFVGKVTVSDRK